MWPLPNHPPWTHNFCTSFSVSSLFLKTLSIASTLKSPKLTSPSKPPPSSSLSSLVTGQITNWCSLVLGISRIFFFYFFFFYHLSASKIIPFPFTVWFQFHCLSTVWPWTRNLTSMCLLFLTCKKRRVRSTQGCGLDPVRWTWAPPTVQTPC